MTWLGDGRGLDATDHGVDLDATDHDVEVLTDTPCPVEPSLSPAGPSPLSSRPLPSLRRCPIPAVLTPRHRRRRVSSPPFSRPRPSPALLAPPTVRASSCPRDAHPPPTSSSLAAGSDLAAPFSTSICSGAPRRRSRASGPLCPASVRGSGREQCEFF